MAFSKFIGGAGGTLTLTSATPDSFGLLTINGQGLSFKVTPIGLGASSVTGPGLVLRSTTPDVNGLLTLEALGISFKLTPLSLTVS